MEKGQYNFRYLTSAFDGVASLTSRPLYSQGGSFVCTLNSRPGAPQKCSGRFGEDVKCGIEEYRLIMTALKIAALKVTMLPVRGTRQITPLRIILKTVL